MSEVATPVSVPVETLIPLCVDLDGTLVKSDTLHDALLVLGRKDPARLFGLFGKIFQGKAAFKAYVTETVVPDVAHLPYNRKLLQFLQIEHARGREIYLTTGADVRIANRIAEHLCLFSGVLGSDGKVNQTGNQKLHCLRDRLSEPFSYIGNASTDLPLLAESAEPMVANPSMRLRAKLRSSGLRPVRAFDERVHPLPSFIKAIRVHQWAKNVLLFLPLILAHGFHAQVLLQTLLAFFCFSLTASATYIINDLVDIEADRRHKQKRNRPFASGDLSAVVGVHIIFLFLGLGFFSARFLTPAFSQWLLLYLAATLGYSFYLKRVPLVDVLVLSGLYTLRLFAGGAATATPISQWLAGFSVFLFFSLALVKRFAELENLRASGSQPRNGRGYLMTDMEQLRAFGTASSYAAVVIFALYISGHDVAVLYHRPNRLWLAVPLLILCVSRIWLLASRGELNEDPVVFAFTDRMSLLIGTAIAAIVLLSL